MSFGFRSTTGRRTVAALVVALGLITTARPAAAAEDIYFSATDNIANVLIQHINAEDERIDMAIWHLTEHSVSIALRNRFLAGVDVRLIGDRAELFELNAISKGEFYWLANEGVPIRVRTNPWWYPEIMHWKATIFAEQGVVAFGSANYTPFELAPALPGENYKDETVLFTDDPAIFNAVAMKFDRMWNDTTPEPESLVPNPPYLEDWEEACATDHTGGCSDYSTLYPNPAEMVINTDRLVSDDHPLPADIVWGQGPSFNNRLIQEINNEQTLVRFVIYRLTVGNITNALLNKWNSGVPVQLLVEPQEYTNRNWPEFWLTHAYIDKLWAAGVPIKKRVHQGLTHMKTLVTSNYASNASANYAAAWQRDINYFIPKNGKPLLYQKIAARVDAMWNDPSAFGPFQPLAPDTATLATPAANATGVATTVPLVWNRAAFATSYDVYLGTSSSNMTLAANVPAQLVNNPPLTYSWTPPALQSGTTYFWRVISRTFATPVDPSLVGASTIRSFTTAGATGPPAAPANPSPSSGASGVSTSPTLVWSAGAGGTTFNVAFGTTSTPPTVANGLGSPSYQPGALAASTTYFWRVTAVSAGGSTPGPLWSFATGSGGGATPTDIVIYATDVTTTAGTWSKVSDSTAAAGTKLTNTDNGAAALNAPLANPTNYFQTTFNAIGGTRYRVWFRIRAIGDQKWNDSFFVQFSDSVNSSGNPVYRIGTIGGYIVNLWTCSDCQSFNWGWQRNAYWLADSGDVWFQNSGTHTIRVQNREDGAEIDQIVLSPVTYASSAPGPVSNDTTIVPKETTSAPGTPGSPGPANNATGVSTSASLSWSASGATSYDVRFGTANPPPQVATGISNATYSPSLAGGTTYFWQIVARNSTGSTTGPVWTFATASAPQPPGPPGSPSPAHGATGVSTTPTLSWTAAGATSYDVKFGTANPPPTVSTGQAGSTYAPGTLANSTTYFWQIVARNGVGPTNGPVWSFTTAASAPPPAGNIVIYASDIPAGSLHGSWAAASDAASPGGTKLVTSDAGGGNLNNPLASPVHYFDVTFTPSAGTPYRIWLRLKALNNSKFNDAVWVQFSDARVNGSPVYQMNSTSGLLVNLATDANATSLNGWGWKNNAYWLSQSTTLTFPAGTQTLRVQIREDGVQLDQIVLSPSTYLSSPPGGPTNDSTIVVKAGAPAPPATPSSPSPANNATGVGSSPTLTWSASGATTYDVRFGTANPPPVVSTNQTAASYTPATLAANTVYFWRVTARNSVDEATGPTWSFTTASAPPPPAGNIVIYASDVSAGSLHGSWATASDAASPGGTKLVTSDAGAASLNNPLAAPTEYFDVNFTATPGTPYRIWLRLKALNNSKFNDAVWVQFSGASAGGSQVYPIGSTSGLLVNLATDSNATSLNGWGWYNTAYWLSQATTVTFAGSAQTLRVQIREDGVQVDQIVLSPTAYLSTAPGPVTNDNTIVPKP